MREQLASNSLPHVELNNRLLSVPIRCFEIPVSTRGKLETFPTRAYHSIRAEIHLEIRNYRGDLRIPRPIVRPLLVPPRHPPPPSSIDADVPRRRITRNFRRDRFHGLPETFESLETPKPGGNAPSLATRELAAGRRFPVVEAACWKKTRRSRRWGNRSGWGKIVGGKVSLNNYAA